jgi:RNA polymerase primary sigma factor
MPNSAENINIIDRYMQAIGGVPLLTAEQEASLADKARAGEKQARDRMILANLRLVVKIAYDYAHMGVPLIDLISEGNLGLIKSVERFDPRKGGRLATYATWWIRQTIKKALADQGKMMRLPMHMVEKIAKLRRASAQLTAQLHREPTQQELARATHFSQKKIQQLQALLASTVPLGASPDSSRQHSLEEILGDEQSATPLATLLQKTDSEKINEAFGSMDARLSQILRLRHGLDGGTSKTLDEIGHIMGLTRERVRQLEIEGQMQLKRLLSSADKPLTRTEMEKNTRERGRVEVLKQFMVEKGLIK